MINTRIVHSFAIFRIPPSELRTEQRRFYILSQCVALEWDVPFAAATSLNEWGVVPRNASFGVFDIGCSVPRGGMSQRSKGALIRPSNHRKGLGCAKLWQIPFPFGFRSGTLVRVSMIDAAHPFSGAQRTRTMSFRSE
jgi:hypothetical protein